MHNTQKTVSDLLGRLAVKWKQNALFLDSQGYCSMQTDDGLDVLLEVKEGSDELFFVADLGTRLTEAQSIHLLHENLFPDRTRMASFCREASHGRVFLSYHYPIDGLSEEVLGALISNFVEVSRGARQLTQELADGKKPELSAHHSRKRHEAGVPHASANLLMTRRKP